VLQALSSKMVYKRTIPEKIRAYIKFYGDEIEKGSMKQTDLVKCLSKKCKVSIPGVYRLLKEPLDKIVCFQSSRRNVGGRKKKLTDFLKNPLGKRAIKKRAFF
jgi:hypothetical protein